MASNKNTMPRRSALALGAATAATVWVGRSPRAQPAGTVKVALLAPMSGPWARQGQLMKLGAEMAVDDVNAAGGVKALNGMKMELVIYDAGDSTEKAKNAAQRMVAQHPDLCGGTGAWLSSFTLAVTEITERAEIPWLTLSYSDQITARGYRYIFQMAPTADEQSTKALPTLLDLAQRATGKRPAEVGLVSDNTASGVSFMKPMRATELAKNGVRAVVDEVYTPPLSDASSIVQHVRSSRPQFILMTSSNVPDNKLLLDKFAEYELGSDKLPKIGNGGATGAPELGTPELGTIVGADIINGYMGIVANWGGRGQEALAKRFIERTKEPVAEPGLDHDLCRHHDPQGGCRAVHLERPEEDGRRDARLRPARRPGAPFARRPSSVRRKRAPRRRRAGHHPVAGRQGRRRLSTLGRDSRTDLVQGLGGRADRPDARRPLPEPFRAH